jgi:hypothetical protein
LSATSPRRGRDGRGHGSHEENSGVWPPVGVARAVPHRTGASATVDADRQLAQVIIEALLPERTRNIVLLAAKVTLRPENGCLWAD